MDAELQFDGDATARVAGGINFSSVVALRPQGERLIDQVQSELRFDFSAVTQTTTAALSLLLCWRRYAAQQQRSIRFVNLPQELHSMAAVSDLELLLE